MREQNKYTLVRSPSKKIGKLSCGLWTRKHTIVELQSQKRTIISNLKKGTITISLKKEYNNYHSGRVHNIYQPRKNVLKKSVWKKYTEYHPWNSV